MMKTDFSLVEIIKKIQSDPHCKPQAAGLSEMLKGIKVLSIH